MATLQTIRDKAGVLISVTIGFALLAFLLTDLLSAGQSMFSDSATDVAEISGNTYSYDEYQQKLQTTETLYGIQGQRIDENNRQQFKDQVWKQFVIEKSLTPVFEEFGIDVSDKELFNLVAGNNVDPLIYQLSFLADPNTGRFDINRVRQFVAGIDKMQPQDQQTWLIIENDIRERRIIRKYNNLVLKSLYATNVDAENNFNSQNIKAEFQYAVSKYENIKNEDVKIENSDIEAHYNENKEKYKQENEWDVSYVTFEITPSKQDKAAALKDIELTKKEFTDDKHVDDFIKYNASTPQAPAFVKQGEITNNELDTFLFSSEKGAIYGPYVEGNAYKIAKVIETKEIADSLWARHIMIAPQGPLNSQEQMLAFQMTVDSIKKVLEADTTQFATMAAMRNTDATKMNGGDLGWFSRSTAMAQYRVMPVMADSIFFAKKGEIIKVPSQMAIHLVQIMGKSSATPHVKVAYIDRTMDISDATRKELYAKAKDFASKCSSYETFKAEAEKNNFQLRVGNRLGEMTNRVGSLYQPRSLVKWATTAEVNEVSEIFHFEPNYVVAVLTSKREEGYASLEEAKQAIVNELIDLKKAEKIIADLGQVTDINAAAAKFGCELFTAQNMAFASSSVPNAGYEPEVVATALTLKAGETSKPIVGKNGVYVVKVNAVEPPAEAINLEDSRQTVANNDRSRAMGNRYMPGELESAIRNRAELVDKRAKFE